MSIQEEIHYGVETLIEESVVYSKNPDVTTREILKYLDSKGVAVAVQKTAKDLSLAASEVYICYERLVEDV